MKPNSTHLTEQNIAKTLNSCVGFWDAQKSEFMRISDMKEQKNKEGKKSISKEKIIRQDNKDHSAKKYLNLSVSNVESALVAQQGRALASRASVRQDIRVRTLSENPFSSLDFKSNNQDAKVKTFSQGAYNIFSELFPKNISLKDNPNSDKFLESINAHRASHPENTSMSLKRGVK